MSMKGLGPPDVFHLVGVSRHQNDGDILPVGLQDDLPPCLARENAIEEHPSTAAATRRLIPYRGIHHDYPLRRPHTAKTVSINLLVALRGLLVADGQTGWRACSSATDDRHPGGLGDGQRVGLAGSLPHCSRMSSDEWSRSSETPCLSRWRRSNQVKRMASPCCREGERTLW